MSDNSRESATGEIEEMLFDMEVITWKIPKISSILFAVDHGVQSPPFLFSGSAWILKAYFYGQTAFKSKGYIDVVIERFHSEIHEQKLSCKIYCRNVFHKEFKPLQNKFVFNSKKERWHVIKLMENFQDKLDKWEIAPNDTFTLVCEIQNMDVLNNTKPVEQAACDCPILYSSVRKHEVGEIYKSSYHLKDIKWTIRNVSTLPSPADSQVQSPTFSFASAFWTLKMFPYFTMETVNRDYFYLVLKRLESEIPEHCVSANICFEDPTDKALTEISRSYIFDSDHVQGDTIVFMFREDNRDKYPRIKHNIFTFFCKFKTKKNAGSVLADSREGADLKRECSLVLSTNKVLQDLKELYLKQEDCDIKLKVKGQEFQAHRAILKARSLVFDSALRNDMKEKVTGVIDIEDCDPNTFSNFLYFLYCGDIENLSVENVFSLFTTADKYDVQDLREKCLEFLKENLTVDTFCDTIALALQHSEVELIKLSTNFFAKNLQKIIVTVNWQLFLAQNPTQSNELLIKALVSEKSSNV